MNAVELEKEIIVALIAAGATIICATINLIGNKKKSAGKSERDIKIKQKATGNINTQIGIQVTKDKGEDDNAK